MMTFGRCIRILSASVLFASAGTVSLAQDAGANKLGYSVTILAGRSASDTLSSQGVSFATDKGSSVAITVMRQLSSMPNVELGFDLGQTSATAPATGTKHKAVSLFARAQYSIAASESINLYGALGLGAMRVSSATANPAFNNADTTAGGLVALGASFDLGNALNLVTELRHVASLSDPLSVRDGFLQPAPLKYHHTSLNVGLKFDF